MYQTEGVNLCLPGDLYVRSSRTVEDKKIHGLRDTTSDSQREKTKERVLEGGVVMGITDPKRRDRYLPARLREEYRDGNNAPVLSKKLRRAL